MNEEKDLFYFIKLIKEFKARKSVTYSEEKSKLHLLQRNVGHSNDNSSQ